ncbi:MAG: chloride channel protein [Thermoplasmata archaeon]|nr:chloride channel protein [Thermoplasmata archaeon]
MISAEGGPPTPPVAGAESPDRKQETPSARPAIGRPIPFSNLSDFTTVDRRTLLLAGVAAGIGVVAALIAALLLGLIGLFTNLFYYGRLSWSFASPAGNSLGLLAIAVPVLGGLIIGAMARFGSERIRGHGIPEALESILIHKSRIQPRVAILKPVSAAISIGTGGPFGAEGPIIMTGGSVGSVLAQTLHLSAAERKTLLVAGAAAGMAATFNTPIAAVLLAVELLLFEWRPRSLIPVGIASAVATVVRWPILGSGPLFPLPLSGLPSAPLVACAALLGIIAGLVATVLTWGVYAFEDLFRRLPVHWMWWPALGGIIIGVGGLIDPRILGVGYNTIDLLLVGGLGVAAILTLLIVKGIVWTASLGSGTSGGVLAPLLMMGAATGTLVGTLLPIGSPSLWALVALGAILGGTMRVPFTGAIFALELTHDLNMLFPLFAACIAAEAVTVFTLPRSILTEKIARRRIHAAREYAVDPLEVTPVKAVMHMDIVLAPSRRPVGEVATMAPERSSRFVGFPLVDDGGHLVGFVTKTEIATYLTEGGDPARAVEEIGSPPPVMVDPDQPIRVAAALLAEYDRDSLPVADPDDPSQVVGLICREDLFAARVLAFQEEQERDRPLTITIPSLRLASGPLGARDPSSEGPSRWSRRSRPRRPPPDSRSPGR